MSKYTTEVRYICEYLAGLSESVGYNDVDTIIEKARPKIFDFAYPIFDAAYKPELERKILKHFYTREIGAEVYGLWHLWLAERMQVIMPGMNKLYESNLLKFDPLHDVDLHTVHEGSEEGTSRESSSDKTHGTGNTSSYGTSEGWNLQSDTPQGGVSGVEDGNYLSQADKTTSETEARGSSVTDAESNSSRNTEHEGSSSYTEHIFGKRGGESYAKMIEDFRASFLNVDNMVFEALEDLFMGLW